MQDPTQEGVLKHRPTQMSTRVPRITGNSTGSLLEGGRGGERRAQVTVTTVNTYLF